MSEVRVVRFWKRMILAPRPRKCSACYFMMGVCSDGLAICGVSPVPTKVVLFAPGCKLFRRPGEARWEPWLEDGVERLIRFEEKEGRDEAE